MTDMTDPVTIPHPWNPTPAQARAWQTQLATQLRLQPLDPNWSTLAVADVSSDRGSPRLFATVLLLKRKPDGSFERLAEGYAEVRATFPYIAGLLSFREVPAILRAFDDLEARHGRSIQPDVILCDGQGLAHPRGLGLACHLGLWLDRPSVGVAKTRLVGQFEPVGPSPGDQSPLIHQGRPVGAVIRTRARAGPLFVSPGHLCDLDSATSLVWACCDGRRQPLPIRWAHEAVNRWRRAARINEPDASCPT